MNWTKKFFDEEYINFYKNTITQEQTNLEVDFLVSIFDKSTITILDAPCGFGRHSIELAKRGYQINGIDLFDTQLDIAKKNSAGINNVTFEKRDIREYIGKNFDATINLFTSFGYFSKVDDKKVLDNLVKSTKIGGSIILDVRNPVRLYNEFASNNGTIKRIYKDSQDQDVETFDASTSTIHILYQRNGQKKEAIINIYNLSELTEWLTDSGAEIIKLFGNFKGDEYDPLTSSRLIIQAKRLS